MSAEVEREMSLHLRAGYRLIAMETFEEDRALRMLERAAKRVDRTLHTWSLSGGLNSTGEGAGSFDAGLKCWLEVEESAVLVILDAHAVMDEAIALRRIRDSLGLFRQRRQTLVLLSPFVELPTELEREAARTTLPLPNAEELTSLFERTVASAEAGSVDPEALDDCVRAALGLSGGEAARVLRKAWLETGKIDQSTATRVVREKRKALHRTPALSFHECDTDLSRVGGLGVLKSWVRDRKRAFGEEARQFGLPSPRGLLLLGVQGCGKSLCAKAVAQEWNFPLLRLDLGAAFGDPHKSPEATVREATAIAESLAPAILWIDEIEKGFAASDTDARASRVFGSFLTWMAEKKQPVFVVATANDVTSLPPELLRRGRFDELFFVDLPGLNEREEILKIHLEAHGRDPAQFPLQELADQAARLSGAELEQVVVAGLYKAFSDNRDLSDLDLANAIQETVPLYDTYEERIKELRNWARTRARPATLDAKMVDLFERR